MYISDFSLIHLQIDSGVVSDPRVAEVLNSVDRAEFCLPTERHPYQDHPHSIGHSATISAPHMHAYALTHSLPTIDSIRSPALSAEGMEKAAQRPVKILDVGSGSGYLTVALAELAGPNSKVVGIEHVPELVQEAQRNVEKSHGGLLREGRVRFVTGDGREGYAAEGPYDIIHVGAAAHQVPQKVSH